MLQRPGSNVATFLSHFRKVISFFGKSKIRLEIAYKAGISSSISLSHNLEIQGFCFGEISCSLRKCLYTWEIPLHLGISTRIARAPYRYSYGETPKTANRQCNYIGMMCGKMPGNNGNQPKLDRAQNRSIHMLLINETLTNY